LSNKNGPLLQHSPTPTSPSLFRHIFQQPADTARSTVRGTSTSRG
jgi:hypothetical protein